MLLREGFDEVNTLAEKTTEIRFYFKQIEEIRTVNSFEHFP